MIPLLFLYFIATLKVFKKSTPNGMTIKFNNSSIFVWYGILNYFLGKVTVYVGKRDFIDHLDSVDPIDGVIVVENDYLQGRKVFGMVKFMYDNLLYLFTKIYVFRCPPHIDTVETKTR